MTTSTTPHIQGAAITKDYPTVFGDGYVTAETYHNTTPLFDAICYPYPASASDNPISSLQEAAYDGNQLSHNGGKHRQSNYDSGFGSCWGDKLFSYNYGPNGNEDSVRTEEPYQNEEHYDTDFSYHEDNVNQPAFDYNACYESCSDYIDDIFTYTEKEPRPTYGSSLEEMGFCEGVFGYWPRLYREMRQNYQQ